MKKILLLVLSSAMLFAAQKFLMPEVAFVPDAKVNSQMQIEANIKIAKDIYLYEEQVKLEIKKGTGISIYKINKPESVEHHGEMVYLKSPSFIITLKKDTQLNEIKNVEFSISYQGCSELGLCYEPTKKVYNFDIDTSKLNTSNKTKVQLEISKEKEKEKIIVEDKVPVKQEISETDTIANTIKEGNIFVILLSFLGFGLLLSLTPCVLPMIPIISGIIVSQGKVITTRKALTLSIVYVLAMAVAYTIAGVLAGLFGANLQVALQTPWVIYTFSAIFVALAMSMFGLYELKLPNALVKKVSSSKNRGGYIGVAIMGFLSALIVGPCVVAPLAGALIYIGQTGDAFLGGIALFAMSIGMGIPLILVGVSAGSFMLKPGAWMTMVSVIFGVMLLGVAVWMLERVVDVSTTMLLYSMIGISFSIYLGVFDKESHIFKRSVAVIIFMYSLALFIGSLSGSTSMTKPLSFLRPQVVSTTSVQSKLAHKKFIEVSSIAELDKQLAKNKGKKVIIDFYADWCIACKELEEVTFADSDVKNKMDEFVLIQADVTDNEKEQQNLSHKYGVYGPPVTIFLDENSKVLKSKTIVGFVGPEEFLSHLNKI